MRLVYSNQDGLLFHSSFNFSRLILHLEITYTNNGVERGQFIVIVYQYQVRLFIPVYLLTNQNVNATTQRLWMVLSSIHVFMSRRHEMCFALMYCDPVYNRAFNRPLRISWRAIKRMWEDVKRWPIGSWFRGSEFVWFDLSSFHLLMGG